MVALLEEHRLVVVLDTKISSLTGKIHGILRPNISLKPTRFRYAPAVGLALR
ncbi:hypothetical protein SAMN05421754_1002124 [Nitrosomonas sp. Nm58]|nr:hypothetical protein SAMN05421754_1002124 [Nitrosomonas sp. Nm58]